MNCPVCKTDTLGEITLIRAWLQAHPQRNMLLAFLQAEDPYQI